MVENGHNCLSARWLYQIIVDNRNDLMLKLRKEGIECGVHYPVNTLYTMYSNQYGKCPRAEWFSEHILSLPMNITMTDNDVKFVIDKINQYLGCF